MAPLVATLALLVKNGSNVTFVHARKGSMVKVA